MATMSERREYRVRVLIALCEPTDAGDDINATVEDVARLAGVDIDETSKALSFLDKSGLGGVRGWGIGAASPVEITPAGVLEAERLAEALEEAEAQADEGPQVIPVAVVVELTRAVEKIAKAIDNVDEDLTDDERKMARAQLDTVTTQLRAPKPDATIVTRAFAVMQWVIVQSVAGVSGNAAFAGIQALIAEAAKHLG